MLDPLIPQPLLYPLLLILLEGGSKEGGRERGERERERERKRERERERESETLIHLYIMKCLHWITDPSVAKRQVEVDTGAGIIGLSHPVCGIHVQCHIKAMTRVDDHESSVAQVLNGLLDLQ